MRTAIMAAASVSACLMGCDSGPRVIFFEEKWHSTGADTILDGASRTSTWTWKDGRYLYVRCFKGRGADAKSTLDLRYSIDVPLLERVVGELKKATDLSLAVGIEGKPAVLLAAPIIGFQHERLFFLADVEKDVVEQMADAKKFIVVPRQGRTRLDKVIEFGTHNLKLHLGPVLEACGAAPEPSGTDGD